MLEHSHRIYFVLEFWRKYSRTPPKQITGLAWRATLSKKQRDGPGIMKYCHLTEYKHVNFNSHFVATIQMMMFISLIDPFLGVVQNFILRSNRAEFCKFGMCSFLLGICSQLHFSLNKFVYHKY